MPNYFNMLQEGFKENINKAEEGRAFLESET